MIDMKKFLSLIEEEEIDYLSETYTFIINECNSLNSVIKAIDKGFLTENKVINLLDVIIKIKKNYLNSEKSTVDLINGLSTAKRISFSHKRLL